MIRFQIATVDQTKDFNHFFTNIEKYQGVNNKRNKGKGKEI